MNSRKVSFIVGFLIAIVAANAAFAVPRADRTVRMDPNGVLRWADDSSEVSLIGVNYYPGFSREYSSLKAINADIKKVMRDDVAHFRRLGLGVVRLHCFERDFSRADGSFVDNIHAELLDYLIDLCAENGIYMVLTPIGWWSGAEKDLDGFSNHYSMPEMTSNPEARAIQVRFLREFAARTNRYTHRRYADDPAILAFECINEPVYPKGHPDGDVTAYANALADALRSAGTKKPIYYNSWRRRNAAVGASRVDGVSGSYYPTDHYTGHALDGFQLYRITGSTLTPDSSIARKSRLIYEFDAPNCPGSYMFPALGKLFRHEGVQVAAQFQYDPLPIANNNNAWPHHFLNLIYTPEKAISLAIMAEVFKALPRLCDYQTSDCEMSFPPFYISAAKNLSEFVTTERYYYSNDSVSAPPDPSALRHIWGCGRSMVAASTGNGAYFLDRVERGVWRLQIFPSVFTVKDPYVRTSEVKEVALSQKVAFSVNLPDLGAKWIATPLEGVADVEGHVLPPGDYVLTAQAPTRSQLAAARASDIPKYVAPQPEPPTVRFAADMPWQWAAGVPLSFTGRGAFADQVGVRFVHSENGTTQKIGLGPVNQMRPKTFTGPALDPGEWDVTVVARQGKGGKSDVKSEHKVRVVEKACDWEFFDVVTALRHDFMLPRDIVWSKSVRDDRNSPAIHVYAKSFDAISKLYLKFNSNCADYARLFPKAGRGRELILHARGASPGTDRIQVVLGVGNCRWSATVELQDEWRDIRIPVSSFTPNRPDSDKCLDVRRVQTISFCLGRWLFPNYTNHPYAVEISSLRVK